MGEGMQVISCTLQALRVVMDIDRYFENWELSNKA